MAADGELAAINNRPEEHALTSVALEKMGTPELEEGGRREGHPSEEVRREDGPCFKERGVSTGF